MECFIVTSLQTVTLTDGPGVVQIACISYRSCFPAEFKCTKLWAWRKEYITLRSKKL